MSFNNKKNENELKLKNKLMNHELEKDDMNIQSYLNTSLDLSGINVSEDLINRTLQAIKQKEAEAYTGVQTKVSKDSADQKKDGQSIEGKSEIEKHRNSAGNKEKKIIPWNRYVRRIAGVAAAVLVVTAGLNLINNMKPNFKSDSSTESTANDADLGNNTNGSSIAESAKGDNSTYDRAAGEAKEDASTPEASQFTISADSNTVENTKESNSEAASQKAAKATDTTDTGDASAKMAKDTTGAATGASQPEVTPSAQDSTVPKGLVFGIAPETGSSDGDTSENEDAASLSESKIAAAQGGGSASVTPGLADIITFNDIFLANPEEAQYVKITDEINKAEITLTTGEEIQNFYNVMDQQQFSETTNAPTAISFTIEAVSLGSDEAKYTMAVGDSISVDCNIGGTISQNFYEVEDGALLINNIEDYFQKNTQ